MKNWSAIAAASGIAIPAAQIDRMSKSLDALELEFRPLADSLTFADEPAVIWDASEDAQ